MDININYLDNIGYCFSMEKKPIECPYCHKTQIPEMYGAIKYKNSYDYFILCQCTNPGCQTAFNVIYNKHRSDLRMIHQSTQKVREFNSTIKDLSTMFCKIYNEAYAAEQTGLEEITGVGYRKALEFLIKDYLISLHPENEEKIKKKLLGNCINDDIDDQRIKQIAKRATWLGNDETHYVRKWEDKDVSHLKSLIDLCLHWIEAEISTKKILEEMPDGKK